MKEKMQKAWNYVKEHKGAIIMGVSTIVLGGLCVYGVKKAATNVDTSKIELPTFDSLKPKKIPVVDLGVGALDDALKYDDWGTVELWLDNLKLDEIGLLGEGIKANIPDLPENANVWALLSIRDDRN